jgi:SSS family solute:Na+ symporter
VLSSRFPKPSFLRTIDLAVFVAYLLSLLVIGGIFYKRSKSSSSYVTGDSRIPAWVISLSLFATFVSSISYLALPGNAFQGNWNPFVFSLSLPLAAVMAVKYFVPLYRRVNSPSAYTFLESRFGPWARVYASIMYLLTQVLRTGTIVYLMALVPHMLFGWSIPLLIVITSLIVMAYSLAGGIQAVIWTDAVQAILLIAGALFCIALIADRGQGGNGEIISIAMDAGKFNLGEMGAELTKPTFWVVLVYGIFINLQNFGADQNYVQRYMSSASLKDAQRSAFWGAMLYLPVSAVFLYIGTSLWALHQQGAIDFPESLDHLNNPDQVFPWFIAHELPPGATGLLLASIYAAGMSTMSTSYNSSATIILTDFFMRGRTMAEPEKMKVLYAATALIAILGLSVGLVMINTRSALDTWWKFASVFSGGVLGLFLLGAFTAAKSKAALAGVAAGLLVIVMMTISGLVPGLIPVLGPIHPYLTIVFGTTTIFIVGFAIAGLTREKAS